MSINQASLTFVRDQPFVDKIVVGFESLLHLNNALNDFILYPGFSYERLELNLAELEHSGAWTFAKLVLFANAMRSFIDDTDVGAT